MSTNVKRRDWAAITISSEIKDLTIKAEALSRTLVSDNGSIILKRLVDSLNAANHCTMDLLELANNGYVQLRGTDDEH